MQIATSIAFGTDTGAAWVAAVDQVSRAPDRVLLHLRTRITHPGEEDPKIRTIVADLLEVIDKQPIETVVNTIFPAALAHRTHDHVALANRYRAIYPTIRKMNHINNRGTYFGRLIDYPARDGPVDQLGRLITHLRHDTAKGRRPRAIYETTMVTPDPIGDDDSAASLVKTHDVQVYAPTPDTIPWPFPCLSHLSFQRDGHRLHLLATYRSQSLIERGYGNFLALGLLQRYIAEHASLQAGELTIDAGLARVDAPSGLVTQHLDKITQGTLL